MSAWPAGVGRIVLDTVDSTNAEALRQMGAGAVPPYWLLARTQSAGRGRRGRPWSSEPGNFCASLVQQINEPPATAAQRSFVASLAVADALQACGVEAERIRLKWPNDVLVGDGKIAGILLESTILSGQQVLTVGVGVNLASAPDAGTVEPGATRPVALSEFAPAPTPEAFLSLLAEAYDARQKAWLRDGFGPTRASWLDRAARLGETVSVSRLGGRVSGRFRSVDDSGALVLETGHGQLTFAAADVYF